MALDALGPLADELTFVGAATVGLWISDPVAPPARATDDVDVVCQATTYFEFARLEARLRKETPLRDDTGMVCRWRAPSTGLILDVVPVTDVPFGFANPWYPAVIAGRSEVELPSGRTLFAAPPPLLIATKIAAWHARGAGDILASRDVEDMLALIDGRPTLAEEIAASPADLQEAIRLWLHELLAHPFGAYAIDAAVSGYGAAAAQRADLVRGRIDRLASP
jgi:hypothetical protein